ncbi:hypothetical protein RvY_05930 [Ramazzottius varieornatus]|uniref:tRNA-dihydrouridine synthase n=1 Tax=Ramazzottius varieornatus TaxID=947166 RepID=A0A1D1V6E5_RAMVA|nr:hypothetical protein RvY_05930 [Ramazzottius varieornatus]
MRDRRTTSILNLLREDEPLKICAPMVRYSKLQFRHLVRKWGADIAFTPMITASSFIKSAKAREVDFSTDPNDRPLIVQFGASSPSDFVQAAEYVADVSDGIDINCGCPQKWAIAEKIGGYLLSHPEIIHDMILQMRNRIPDESFTKSIKIRVEDDITKTVDLCRQLESGGVSFITVHGRTIRQKSEPANWDAIKTIKQSVRIPVFGNGDIKVPGDVDRMVAATGVDGVMAANALLMNPALFAGHEITPLECVADWLDINEKDTTCPFRIFHHHLIWMLDKHMTKAERIGFSDYTTKEQVVEYVTSHFDLPRNTENPEEK